MNALVTPSGVVSEGDPVWKIVSSRPEGRTAVASSLPQSQHSKLMRMASSSPASRRNAKNALKLKEQARKKGLAASPTVELDKLEPIHRRAAGIDIGSAEN